MARVAVTAPRAGGTRVRRLGSAFTWHRLAAVGPFLLFFGLWEVLADLAIISPLFFPAPSRIAQAFVNLTLDGQLPTNLVATLGRFVGGFLLGAVPAVVLGIAMGLVPLLRTAMRPVITVVYPLPKMALLPLLILLLGIGEANKYAIVALSVFFPVLINCVGGVLSIPTIYWHVGRNFGARGLNAFLTIALPGALPQVFTGLRIGISSGLIVVIGAEMLFAETGIGQLIWASWRIFFLEQMYVGLVIIGILGYVTNRLTDLLEHRLIPWRSGVTSY